MVEFYDRQSRRDSVTDIRRLSLEALGESRDTGRYSSPRLVVPVRFRLDRQLDLDLSAVQALCGVSDVPIGSFLRAVLRLVVRDVLGSDWRTSAVHREGNSMIVSGSRNNCLFSYRVPDSLFSDLDVVV